MKKVYLLLSLFLFIHLNAFKAQCVPSCSVYAVSPITFSTFPAAGNAVSLTDDSMSGSIPIGFTFTFFCNTYNSVLLCSNGWLTFDLTNTTASYPGQTIPSSATPNNFIAWDWTDLNPGAGGSITYTTIGTTPNRQFIITYSNIPCYNSTLLNTCQTILFETTNNIEIHCSQISNNGPLCTQGIENSGGTAGYFRPGANASSWTVSTPDAYRYTFGYSPTAPTAVSGTTLLCEGVLDTYLATTMPGALSYNWSLPPGWMGTSTVSAITATTGSSGNIQVTATYSCGTSLPTTLSVTVIPAPVLSISSTSAIICSGQSLTINGSGTGVVNYTLDPAGLTGTPPFVISPQVTTVFTLLGENASGCISNSTASVSINVKPSPTISVNSGSVCLGQTFTMNPTGANSYVYSSLFNVVTPTSAGIVNYTVTGTNANGCTGPPVISTLIVNALPNVNLLASRPVICIKESASLTASGASTYSWSNSTSTSSVISVSPLSSTFYTVTGTQAGCSKSATVLVVVNLCNGVGELNHDLSSEIQIFPNPSQGEFTVSTQKDINVRVYDASGRLILEKKYLAGEHKLDLSDVGAGNYFFKSDDGIIKQNTVLIKQ